MKSCPPGNTFASTAPEIGTGEDERVTNPIPLWRESVMAKKTRGVFGIFLKQDFQLLSERDDGKGWNCLGGRVEEGESDEATLTRECDEEAKIKIRILQPFGDPMVFNDDTAQFYLCEIADGHPTPSKEAKRHCFLSELDVRRGWFQMRHKDEDAAAEGIGMTCGYSLEPVKLVGPTDKLGRTARAVWDAFSIVATHSRDHDLKTNPGRVGYYYSACGCYICLDQGGWQQTWRRLDPFSPTGFVEPLPLDRSAHNIGWAPAST